ncbi:helix-turn-helix domain-containing protein [Sphingomonas colocasiae]|uniref:Helix-turn-helix transcriptional regulator n=1 Tax=Sphingomonas colocasiae TaxID=1848973 RepID=A0ABS7PPI8_9SPHN|nr:helix-turn-helix transcriptional regulator [Sphingomonas colocasiae]
MRRTFLLWKKATLASMAGVSLSSVERLERGQAVSDTVLEKIAVALDMEPEAFVELRPRISEAEALERIAAHLATYADKIQIPVAPFRHEHQLRSLSEASFCVVDTDIEEASEDLAGLREWLDLTGFMRAHDGTLLPNRERSFRLRRLYGDVFANVKAIERRYSACCLAGIYDAGTNLPGSETVTAGVIVLRSRARNPASDKIRQLWVEKWFDGRAAMAAYMNAVP